MASDRKASNFENGAGISVIVLFQLMVHTWYWLPPMMPNLGNFKARWLT